MPSRSKKILSPIPVIPNGEQNVTEIIRQVRFSSRVFRELKLNLESIDICVIE